MFFFAKFTNQNRFVQHLMALNLRISIDYFRTFVFHFREAFCFFRAHGFFSEISTMRTRMELAVQIFHNDTFQCTVFYRTERITNLNHIQSKATELKQLSNLAHSSNTNSMLITLAIPPILFHLLLIIQVSSR